MSNTKKITNTDFAIGDLGSSSKVTTMDMMLATLALVLWLSRDIVEAAPPMAKPGCPDKCGDVTIPYPFGIGSRCYYNEWYEITCNTSNPMLTKFSLQVLKISLSSSQVIINAPTVVNSTAQDTTWTSANLGGSPYSFSSIYNDFAPVSCVGTSFVNGGENIVARCGSFCNSQIRDNTTSQESICLSVLPYPLSIYGVSITRTNGTYSYVLVASRDFLNNLEMSNPQQSLLSLVSNGSHVPVNLDWKYFYLPNQFLNESNSGNCNMHQANGVYTCTCPQRQGGNPYLPNGCQESPRCASCKGDCYVISDDYMDVGCYIPKKSRAHLLGVVLGLSIGIGSLLASLGCYWLWQILKRRKKIKVRAKNFKQNGGLLLQRQMCYNDCVVEKTKVFTVSELEVATDHFNENRILGQGGQGTVYKGMLTDGRVIAVKKSKKVDESQLEPFINEVVILSQINHRNVVKLLGCCLETEVPLLVYEFIPNGTLSQHIHNPSEEFHIPWKMRLQIAAESAGAIAYLHSSSSAPIYHRDIKSSNILLDDKYRAKVSDFGTSRTILIDQTHLTTQVQGTFGYLDPEYFQSNQFTEKSDVYSFGVVLVELMTSKKPISPDKSKEWRSLATEFLLLAENSCLSDIFDPHVSKEAKQEELEAVANLAKECLNLNGKQRPTMKEVAIILDGLQSRNETSSIQQTFPEWNQAVTDVSVMDTAPFTSSTFFSQEEDALILHI
ncbi:putative wall-associated receptor kinase-like 16 [Chenopodium quinoa]|uniref:Protein kinase domain-containing protein n=1 Tax=Chenopodium quinoa TaxID=63459 RepID=A0A803L490_CHEQI|nr:putative wall-associated receptor kinase-like 16 [Chenopodium quinoa]